MFLESIDKDQLPPESEEQEESPKPAYNRDRRRQSVKDKVGLFFVRSDESSIGLRFTG